MAPWRTRDGAFLLGEKKHRSDRYAYRTTRTDETQQRLPAAATMPMTTTMVDGAITTSAHADILGDGLSAAHRPQKRGPSA